MLEGHEHVEFQLRIGNPAVEVLSAAREAGADLILMGGYTASPWLEALRGSTVETLLRNSSIPILLGR